MIKGENTSSLAGVFHTSIGLIVGLFLLLGLPTAHALDSRANIDKAVNLIEADQHALARSYLTPALMDHRLDNDTRSKAYYLLGFSYYDQGMYVSASQEFNRALEFNPNNPAVQAALGGLYFYGQGVDQDEALGLGFFESAAGSGHLNSIFHLGFAYLTGRGAERDLMEARGWLEESAEAGHTLSMLHLAGSYRVEATDKPSPDIARQWYEKAAEAGMTDALVPLAYMYKQGEFGEPDQAKATALFQQVADTGSAHGQVNLGHQYLIGSGAQQSNEKALKLFMQAGAQGSGPALFRLGHMYEAGLGVAVDDDQAWNYYTQAAELDEVGAQLRVAELLLQNNDEAGRRPALKWLARATQLDHPQAHNDYAWLLATSTDIDIRNGELALKHAKRATTIANNAAYLDTLAAAYAELGKFSEAVETQLQALASVPEGDERLNRELNTHLRAYQAEKAWRE